MSVQSECGSPLSSTVEPVQVQCTVVTCRLQEPGDVQLLLCNPERFFQVLPVGPVPGLGQIHQVGTKGV